LLDIVVEATLADEKVEKEVLVSRDIFMAVDEEWK